MPVDTGTTIQADAAFAALLHAARELFEGDTGVDEPQVVTQGRGVPSARASSERSPRSARLVRARLESEALNHERPGKSAGAELC